MKIGLGHMSKNIKLDYCSLVASVNIVDQIAIAIRHKKTGALLKNKNIRMEIGVENFFWEPKKKYSVDEKKEVYSQLISDYKKIIQTI